MHGNPYESSMFAASDVDRGRTRGPARRRKSRTRMLIWLFGFLVLFLVDVFVEGFVLPRLGMENTPQNDLFFQTWWLLVGLWFMGGNAVISAITRSRAFTR